MEYNYEENASLIEEQLVDGTFGPSVITDEPLDSEFDAVYRDYTSTVGPQVQHDEDGDDMTMTQAEILTGESEYDGDADNSDNPSAAYTFL